MYQFNSVDKDYNYASYQTVHFVLIGCALLAWNWHTDLLHAVLALLSLHLRITTFFSKVPTHLGGKLKKKQAKKCIFKTYSYLILSKARGRNSANTVYMVQEFFLRFVIKKSLARKCFTATRDLFLNFFTVEQNRV